jgi:hypothetical protein
MEELKRDMPHLDLEKQREREKWSLWGKSAAKKRKKVPSGRKGKQSKPDNEETAISPSANHPFPPRSSSPPPPLPTSDALRSPQRPKISIAFRASLSPVATRNASPQRRNPAPVDKLLLPPSPAPAFVSAPSTRSVDENAAPPFDASASPAVTLDPRKRRRQRIPSSSSHDGMAEKPRKVSATKAVPFSPQGSAAQLAPAPPLDIDEPRPAPATFLPAKPALAPSPNLAQPLPPPSTSRTSSTAAASPANKGDPLVDAQLDQHHNPCPSPPGPPLPPSATISPPVASNDPPGSPAPPKQQKHQKNGRRTPFDAAFWKEGRSLCRRAARGLREEV